MPDAHAPSRQHRAACAEPVADRLWVCFIADGTHVPFLALGNYLRLAGEDRSIIVSDAIAPAGLGPGRYTLGRWDIVVGDDMVPRAPDRSHFVGSGINMKQSAENLRAALGLAGRGGPPADL